MSGNPCWQCGTSPATFVDGPGYVCNHCRIGKLHGRAEAAEAEVDQLRAEVAKLRQELQQANAEIVKLIAERTERFRAHEAAEAELSSLRTTQARLSTLLVDARRKAPTHGVQEWDWLLGELATLVSKPQVDALRSIEITHADAAAIHRWLELVMDDRKFFNPVVAAVTERATLDAKGRLAAGLAKR